MSILVIHAPPRVRLQAGNPGGADQASVGPRGEYRYVLSADGLTVAAQGTGALALLPRADSVALVLADTDVAWHRITLPKAPAAKLRAALAGTLEEALLADADNTHLALAPHAVAGQPTWVAAVDRAWLNAELSALERANVFVDVVLPISWPDAPTRGRFFYDEAAQGEALMLSWADADGVAVLRLQGSLARRLLPQALTEAALWTATPAAAAAAERWLDAPVVVVSMAERALQATRSQWNLRQFDLARRSKGTRALTDGLRGLLSPAWRPLRYGIVALVVTQAIGLNLWAWRLRAAVDERRAAQVTLLQTTFPNVHAVLDAPVQMKRELAALRSAAGKPDDSDLEPLLQAAASVWPADLAAVESIRFEPGRLTLGASSWNAGQIEQFRTQLRPRGLQVEASEGRLVVSRSTSGAARS